MQRPEAACPRLLALAVGALVAASGCAARPGADARVGLPGEDVSAPPVGERTVHFDTATFQLARGGRVEIALFRSLAPAAAGSGAPAAPEAETFDYVRLDLPEGPHYGWVAEDAVDGWRWIREPAPGGAGLRDRIWHADEGRVRMSLSPDGTVLYLDLSMTLGPAAGAPQKEIVTGLALKADLKEDVLRTQGLANTYGRRLEAMLEAGRRALRSNPR